MHGEIPGHTVLGGVHPVGAPNKTLISDTVKDRQKLIRAVCYGCSILGPVYSHSIVTYIHTLYYIEAENKD